MARVEKPSVLLSLLQGERDDYVHEEYTTATYEARLQTDVCVSACVRACVCVCVCVCMHVIHFLLCIVQQQYDSGGRRTSPAKVSRSIVLPPTIRRVADDPVERSKRLLGAAGLFGGM